MEGRLEPAHAAQPSIIIAGLPPEVFGDFGVRQDEKVLVPQPGNYSLGDGFRFNGAVSQHRPNAAAGTRDHIGLHAERAEARNLYALGLIGNREPLGKGDGRMFGDRIAPASRRVSNPAADAVFSRYPCPRAIIPARPQAA